MLLVKLIEPPCTERYARWCERSKISPNRRNFLLLDWKNNRCDDIIFIKLLGDGTCMNIYDLLKECIEIKKYGLNAGVFKDEDRERLDTEEEKLVFDLLKNVSSMAI